MAHGCAEQKDALVERLHRIEGQVRRIERMVEDDRYCETDELLAAVRRFAKTR